MASSHGILENEIMNAVWLIEEENDCSEISVSAVVNIINQTGAKKAYTTVKTVMDRLVDKKYLKRFKVGKKFVYNSTSSRAERAEKAIRTLAGQYFNNDIHSLMKVLEKQCLKSQKK